VNRNSHKQPNGDETTELHNPAIRTASFVQGKLPQLLCLCLRLLSMTFAGLTEGKKRDCEAFKHFCNRKVPTSYTALSILSLNIEISPFAWDYHCQHEQVFSLIL